MMVKNREDRARGLLLLESASLEGSRGLEAYGEK